MLTASALGILNLELYFIELNFMLTYNFFQIRQVTELVSNGLSMVMSPVGQVDQPGIKN